MEAVGKHNFAAKDSTELTFNKGDQLLILSYADPNSWCAAELNGKRGMVPGNYISIDFPKWFMGRIPRAAAEQLLLGHKLEGAFLVRLSESSPEDFSLSVKCGDSVQHFRILRDQDHKFFLWNTRFYSLNKLVDHYREETVSRNSKICLRDIDEQIVEAIYDFRRAPEEPDSNELEFNQGELITVDESSDEHWWSGRIGDRVGFFPRTFVRPYRPHETTIGAERTSGTWHNSN